MMLFNCLRVNNQFINQTYPTTLQRSHLQFGGTHLNNQYHRDLLVFPLQMEYRLQSFLQPSVKHPIQHVESTPSAPTVPSLTHIQRLHLALCKFLQVHAHLYQLLFHMHGIKYACYPILYTQVLEMLIHTTIPRPSNCITETSINSLNNSIITNSHA